MNENELTGIIKSQIAEAESYGSELSESRSDAMDRYLGEPYGDEIDGRSSVVSMDVLETIEWMMPSLIKTFVSSDDVVRFDPVGPEDEEQAEQESDYVNYVFTKENNALIILYTWFKDALIQKNGIVKTTWDDTEEVTTESYANLTEEEVIYLSQDPELEIIEADQGEYGYNIKFSRTCARGKVEVMPVPPDEFLIHRGHNSVDVSKALFCAHKTEETASDLIQRGIKPKIVATLPTSNSNNDTEEEISRNYLDEETTNADSPDESTRLIECHECYVMLDYNGDDVAELRRILYAGNRILENEEADRIPFSVITPIILGHKFNGLSVADLVTEISKIKTALLRQMLDNLYLTNNPEKEVVADQVNIDDLLTSRPGGIKRVKQPGMIRELAVPFTAGASFPMLEYWDGVTEKRTGVGPQMMGQNYDLSNDTAHGIERLMTAAEAKIELIARVFAETGVKDLFRQIHELLIKHQDKEKVVKLRNKWVPVDPSEWRTRNNMTVQVGLGTGERNKQSAAIREVLMMQKELVMAGYHAMVTEKNVFNALQDFAKFAGLKSVDPYINDPDSEEAQKIREQMSQNKQQDPQQALIAAQMQIERQKAEVDMMKAKQDGMLKQQDQQLKMAELEFKRADSDRRNVIDMQRFKGDISAKDAESIRRHTEAMEKIKQEAAVKTYTVERDVDKVEKQIDQSERESQRVYDAKILSIQKDIQLAEMQARGQEAPGNDPELMALVASLHDRIEELQNRPPDENPMASAVAANSQAMTEAVNAIKDLGTTMGNKRVMNITAPSGNAYKVEEE